MLVPPFRWSCDSLVALPRASAAGITLFAKNSDRPALECQPLCDVPAADHSHGAELRCTYITIPQVSHTYRVIGSRPYWCWGFEHGVNEHGVAIGNHTVFTKEPVDSSGLLGMDLVRLGLERARSAREALEVMVQLLAAHGQGGSGYADKDWPYHNSFLIADPVEAFVWETSGRHWAAKRVSTVASVSNHLTIGADWDELSPDTVAFAVEQGWWPRDSTDRFDFARAYRDTTVAPEVISSGRYGRTCALLERAQGSVDAAQLRGWLRDHYGRVDPRAGVTPADPEYFSICMHADPVGTTTASVVAELRSEPKQTLYWASLGSPCASVFFPIFLDVALPPVLTEGSESDSDRSAWWQFHRLLERVEQSWEERLPLVRRAFDALEAAFAERVPELLNASREERQSFVDAATVEILEVASDLIRRFR